MNNKLTIITFLITLFILTTAQEKVLLSSVRGLTFYRGRYTTGRRAAPSMQLKRVGGEAQTNFEPESIYCENRGTDGMSIQWKCETETSSDFRLGKVEVVCEGYDRPGDSYVLAGSCSLEYSLEYTARGKTKERKRNERTSYQNNQYEYHVESSGSGLFEILLFFIILIAFLMVIFRFCSPNRYGTVYQQAPSYGYQQVPGYSHTTYVHQNNGGFWNGMGLGYLWGSSNQPYYNNGGYNRGSSWFPSSSYNSSYNYDNSSSSYDDDSSTHTTTGYGGTRTR